METINFHPQRTRMRGVRYAFYHLYIAWLLGVGAVILIPVGNNGETGSNFLFSLSWIAIHISSFLLMISFKGFVRPNFIFCIALSSFIVISVFWSNSPFNTFIYGGMLAGNILTAYMMSNDISLDNIIEILARIIAFFIIIGLISYYIGYDQVYHYDRHSRDNILGGVPLRGFFNHKVMASLFASIGIIAILSSLKGAVRFSLIFLSILFILLTGSATGLILCFLSIAIYIVIYKSIDFKIKRSTFFAGLIVSTIALSISLYSIWGEVLNFLGRDGTLTGRTFLWELGFRVWMERPFLGWGFDGYFGSPESDAIRSYIGRYRNYDIPHFHQSYIQTLVDLGIVGFFSLAYVLIYCIYKSYPRRYLYENSIYSASFTMTIIMVIASFTMFLFLNYNHFANFLIFLIFFSLKRMKNPRDL